MFGVEVAGEEGRGGGGCLSGGEGGRRGGWVEGGWVEGWMDVVGARRGGGRGGGAVQYIYRACVEKCALCTLVTCATGAALGIRTLAAPCSQPDTPCQPVTTNKLLACAQPLKPLNSTVNNHPPGRPATNQPTNRPLPASPHANAIISRRLGTSSHCHDGDAANAPPRSRAPPPPPPPIWLSTRAR